MLKDLMQYQESVEKFPSFPQNKRIKTFTFQVTNNCSLCCSYCYQINKGKNKMSFEIAKEAIDYLLDNRLNKDFYFSEETTAGIVFDFIGGEPLLEIDLIHQIIEYCEYKFLLIPESSWNLYHIYHIGSNGVDYFSPKVQDLFNKYGALINFSITVDGCKELHDKCRLFPSGEGSYDLALSAALDNLHKHGNVSTKITLAPDNIQYTYEAITNMLSLGFKYIHINCVFEEGWEPKHAKILLYELIKVVDYLKANELENECYIAILDNEKYLPRDINIDQNYCGSTCAMLAVDYKGDIYPCLRFMESSLGNNIEPYIIGTTKNGIGYTEKELKKYSDLFSITKTSQSSQDCLNCSIESGCAWCTAYNYQKFGTINKRSTFHCDMHKAASLASYYLFKNTDKAFDPISFQYVKHFIDLKEYNDIIGKGENE